MARGKDDRKLDLEHVRKTVSAEVNYGIRFTTWEEADQFLDQLSEEVSKRLSRLQLVGRSVTLKLMVRADDAPEETAKFNGHGVCDNISKSSQLNIATSSKDVIKKEVIALVKSSSVSPKDMRGVGITMSKLEQGGSANAGSNTSILKFVQKEFKTNVTEKEKIPTISKQNIDAVIDPEFLSSLPPDIRAEVEAHAKASVSKASLKRKDNPLKEKSKSRNPFSIRKADKENEHFDRFSLDTGVLDQEVLNQLPPEIKAEIEERFKVGTPTVKSNAVGTELNSATSDSKMITESEKLPLASSSSSTELDPTFLDQLPPDIRAEIEGEYNSRGAYQTESVNTTPVKKANDIIAEDESSCDISFSQVDHTVLAELPAEMQAELKKQYNYSRAKKSRNNVQPRTAFDAIMKTSPGKSKASPVKRGNSKRGRKKGGVKRAVKVPSPSKQGRDFDTNFIPEESNSVDMDVFNALPDFIKAEVEAQMKNNTVSTILKVQTSLPGTSKSKTNASTSKPTSRALFQDTKTESVDETVKEVELNKLTTVTDSEGNKEGEKTGIFCGKTTISEIRPLLKEWIASSSEPLEDDVEMLSDFFKDLIENWKIDLLQVILKCLFRNIEKLKSGHLWQEAWENMVQKVQTVMIQNYGNPLYISDSF